ncbi:MAG: Gfo/Idh/MocA family oxidoreductase [Bdellovibrionales bacterium]|nr:Gfo/Idh/MocA family oxidoreductase [Bdellovibrionales bacterium]
MKALIVGYGSIGQRHERLLKGLGLTVGMVSRHAPGAFLDLKTGVSDFKPDYVVIANPTDEHLGSLAVLGQTGYRGKVLIEKPLFSDPTAIPELQTSEVYVAYQLRFHPALVQLKSLIRGAKIISVNAYVGQYLPMWRPGRDYRERYSASREKGGGVIRDLSHELDYLNWLFGKPESLTAVQAKWSQLEITSDDTCQVMMRFQGQGAASLEVNYNDRMVQRYLTVNTQEHTYRVDLISGRLNIDTQIQDLHCEVDHPYVQMHRSILSENGKNVCTLGEGVEILNQIAKIEKASASKTWVAV